MHPDTQVKAGYSGVPETPGDSLAAPSRLLLAGAHPETPGKAGYSGEAPELDCFEGKKCPERITIFSKPKGNMFELVQGF